MTEAFIAAILMGLAGSGHCLGMCGGIAAAIGQQSSVMRVLSFNVSRLLSYALIALILGGSIELLSTEFKHIIPLLRILAGLLLIAMGLYMLDWWRGLLALETLGGRLWRHIQPLTSQLMGKRSVFSTFLMGLLWGFLPCGLVYSALAWAVSHSADSSAAILMIGFGIGTLPSILGTSLAGQTIRSFLQQRLTRNFIAYSMMLFGLWTLAMPVMKLLKMH